MSDTQARIDELESHMATSRKVRSITITLAIVCIVAGFIIGRWSGVVSFVVVVSSFFTVFIAAYITGMRILMFKHEIRQLEQQTETGGDAADGAAAEA